MHRCPAAVLACWMSSRSQQAGAAREWFGGHASNSPGPAISVVADAACASRHYAAVEAANGGVVSSEETRWCAEDAGVQWSWRVLKHGSAGYHHSSSRHMDRRYEPDAVGP